jgi:hypothetical protein
MAADLDATADLLLANFHTIRFPRLGPEWSLQKLYPEPERREIDLGIEADQRFCVMHRDRMRLTLWNAGHCRFFDRIEGWLTGGWRIHLFLAEPEAVSVIDPAGGVLSAGDPIRLDPAAFVRRQLQSITRLNRLTSGHPWCDPKLPPIRPGFLAGIVL